ncbi:9617_t:CDS:2 [Ambispora leptoticha]|uniref:9617_t:CDS:1 n=1 Tax=Ambispora leptoticha TaxID=144679 RepID=A0A9N9GQL2_9GLOM|nr:9617_t:CDS:2 [Ambispora leptoticha]
MKILATRLNEVCKSIIPNHQQGFVTQRSIADAALDILTTMRNQTDITKQHWMLFVDQKKAFDRVDHTYLQTVLEKMNFDIRFRRVIENLFSNQEAHIMDSGDISTFEPLLKAIENEIQGIPVQGHFFKTVAYADDLTIGIGSPSDWNRVLELFHIYESASNAKINESKTKLVPLTVMARRVELTKEKQFTKIAKQEAITILGYEIYSNGTHKKDLWTTVTTKIKNLTDKFSQRNLSFRGKILVANSLVLARIWYAAYLLPPSRKQILNLLLSYEHGGLQAPIVSNMLNARMLTVWTRLTTGDCLWAKIERNRISSYLKQKRDITVLQSLTSNPIKSKAWPTEWKPYLAAWKKIQGKITANHNWPWKIEDLKVDEKQNIDFTVKNLIGILRKRTVAPTNTILLTDIKMDWLFIKANNNKKKDILWRMYHKALPLGYRLQHISATESGKCLWCPEELQTIEHFALECIISKKI